MDIVSLVVQIIAGAVGGNAVGMSKQSMGTGLNSIVGGIGGVVLGQIVASITGEPDGAAAGGGIDVAALISSIIGGGAGGVVLTFIVSLIKSKLHPQ